MKELRRTNRFPVQRAVLYRSQAQAALGTVCEISLTGVKLRGHAVLEAGAPVTLTLLGPGTNQREIRCRVHWQELRASGEREAGMSFVTCMAELVESWVGDLLCELEATGPLFQRRESVRVPVRLPARAGREEEDASRDTSLGFAEVVELSEGGAILRTRRDWEQDERVRLRLSLLGRVIHLTAVVLSVRRPAAHSLAGTDYSLQFTNVGSREAEVLRRMVSSAVRRRAA